MAEPPDTATPHEAMRIVEILFQCLPGMVYRCRNDARWTMEYVSPGARGVTGYAPERFGPDGDLSFDFLILPEDRARVRAEVDSALAAGGSFQIEYRLQAADGETRWVFEQGCPLPESNLLIGFITRNSARRAAEQQQRRSQRLEALGRLAAGVAHDFNNLLTIILSYSELALDALEETHPVRSELGHVRDAAERGALLTRQLLTYTRGAPTSPTPLDLSGLVRGLKPMLRRVVPEDTHLRLDLAAGLPPVIADAGSLEQVIVNLTVNARDAMPEGGEVVIRTELVELGPQNEGALPAGEYVRLSVSDQGEGVPVELRERIFDPFFTTKPSGQGTGLGLSTVRDIIREAGGEVVVTDAIEGGACVVVHLPRVTEDVDHVPHSAETPSDQLGGHETVLVVEDDQALRRLMVTILDEYGYHVLQARDGVDALRVWTERGADIDMVISDVVMPRLGGPALIATLASQRPGLKHLFVSGYSSSEALEGPMIHKPFTPERLLQAVRATLGSAG